MITPNSTLENIVKNLPQSTRILRAHHLDFCCGGQQTLQQACQKEGIAPDKLIHELMALKTEKKNDPAELPVGELADYIVQRFHEDLRKRIPELILLAKKVEWAHKDSPECPKGLSQFLLQFEREMGEHMQKEEQVLFPMIKEGKGKWAMMPVQCMKKEHDEHGKNLERLRGLAKNFVVPEGACPTWRALYANLDELEQEVMEHIYLENHVLFRRCLEE